MPATTTTPAAAPALIDVRAVAELLGCSDRHVFRLAKIGRIPRSTKLGALVRWRRTEIERWIADGCPAVDRTAKSQPQRSTARAKRR